MALLLAPYNEGMRIGMGFNSYTQQLCTNDVVRLPGGIKASEKNLRSVDPKKGVQSDGSKPLLSDSGGTVIKKPVDGQSDVSQVVTWKAGFVDNLSDVTSSLNISGALDIKVAAIGGGGGASGHFANSTKFVKSNAKYEITVKVINQKLSAEDVTEFTPIPNVPASKFNEVYGDCFISGFIEGGVFSAVVLKTLVNNEDLKKIGGSINVNLDFKVVQVSGSASGEKTDESKTTATMTDTILQWSGGGDIKPDSIATWDIDTLMRVAMEFPDRVASCPQRTFAILTKYTSLRSFHEQTVKGTPLDYEIAGIYTNALLDSYALYKAMWEDLHQTIKEVDQGTSSVRTRESNPKLIGYGNMVKADYDKRKAAYDSAKDALQKSSYPNDHVTLEEPLPANPVTPYQADAFGLDQAVRDCRFEMIKIVREVDAVTYDPQVATDPNRDLRFLSPNVFKLLLPTDKEPMPTPEEIAKMKQDLKDQLDRITQQQNDLDTARTEKSTLQARVTQQDEESKSKDEQIQRLTSSQVGAAASSSATEQDLRNKLSSAENQLTTERAAAAAKASDLLKNIDTVKKQADDDRVRARADLDNARAKFDNDSKAIRSETDILRKQFDDAKRELDRARQIGQLDEALVIYSISWAGRELRGTPIEANIRNLINNRANFNWENTLFGPGDPLPNMIKSGSIIYKRKDGPVIIKVGKERDPVANFRD